MQTDFLLLLYKDMYIDIKTNVFFFIIQNALGLSKVQPE